MFVLVHFSLWFLGMIYVKVLFLISVVNGLSTSFLFIILPFQCPGCNFPVFPCVSPCFIIQLCFLFYFSNRYSSVDSVSPVSVFQFQLCIPPVISPLVILWGYILSVCLCCLLCCPWWLCAPSVPNCSSICCTLNLLLSLRSWLKICISIADQISKSDVMIRYLTHNLSNYLVQLIIWTQQPVSDFRKANY